MGIVDVAMAEVGTKESGTNNVKYNTWYYGHAVSGDDYAWCAVFVSWCANQAGCLDAIGGKKAGVSALYDYFKSNKIFHAKGSGYKPKAGDIMIQKNNGASHTGIVYAADDNSFYTVEGNSSDKVQKCQYAYTSAKLTGWGSPNYDGSASSGSYSTDDAGSGSGGTSQSLGLSTTYKSYTVKSGDTLQSIAEKFNTTAAMIIFLNNLTSTDVKAGKVLKVPDSSHGDWDSAAKNVDTVTKTHTKQISVSYPYIECMFYTENGMLAAVADNQGDREDASLKDDIISLTTVRNMTDDCPTFTINLVWRNDWFTNLASNDMVIITMQRPPEAKRKVMYGLIDDIRRSMDFSGTQPQRTVQVTGRGFNKAFVNFDIGVIQNMCTSSDSGFLANLSALQNASSAEAIKSIVESYVGSVIEYNFGNGKKFTSYFRKNLTCHDGEMYGDITNQFSYIGSLWNFIKEIGNSPFDETFWEVNNGYPTLVHRETPFNKNKWTALNKNIIEDYDIVNDGLGRSDLETYTLFRLTYAFDDALSAGYNPLWYKPFYSKYGLSILEISTPYLTMDGGETNTDTIKTFLIDLFNWNIKNNIFYNGSLTVKGMAKYKIGERVILHSENLEFYVESVTQSFTLYGSWNTTLGLTRGIQPEKRFAPPWGDYDEFTDACMQAIINTVSGEDIDWTDLPPVEPSSGDSGSGGSTSNLSDAQVQSNMNTIYTWLTGTGGYTKAQAVGIIANIDAESSFDPAINGDSGTSYGLCQWHNSRKTNVKKYCMEHYGSYSSIKGQLEFMKSELDGNTAWGKMKSQPNTAEGAYYCAYYFCVYFEVPKYKESKGQSRGTNAKKTFWNKF